MEKGVSKVKSVQGCGTYDSQYGVLYKYDYELEDGTSLVANHKKAIALAVGTDVEYEIKGSNDSGSWGTVQKWTPESHQYASKFSNNSTKKENVQELIVRQSCLKVSLEHLTATKSEFNKENVTALAEYFKEYVYNGL